MDTSNIEENKEDFGVIEQDYSHVDYNENGDHKFIIDGKKENIEKLNKLPTNNRKRCKFIKKNGKQCRQSGKENQSGGEIINGYCNYHRKTKN